MHGIVRGYAAAQQGGSEAKLNSQATVQQRIKELTHYLEAKIASGEWTLGTRLPPERELAQRFRIGRYDVRRVLTQWEAQGKVKRHVGRGTFLVDPALGQANPATLGEPDASPAELIELRLLLEPAATELAVLRAANADIAFLRKCVEKTAAASTWQEFERWDVAFHEAIMRITRNGLILKIFYFMAQVRQQTEWGRMEEAALTKARRQEVVAEHKAILDAISERDAQTAGRAVEAHIRQVREALFGSVLTRSRPEQREAGLR